MFESLARVGTARAKLLQSHRLLDEAVARGAFVHLTIPRSLALAGGRAGTPICPVGQGALHWQGHRRLLRLAACFCLRHAVAAMASPYGRLQYRTFAVLLVLVLARRFVPRAPFAHDTIFRPRTLPFVARLRLAQFVDAWPAQHPGTLLESSEGCLPAPAAGGAANRPLAPLGEGARELLVLSGATWLRLLEAAGARCATEDSLLCHLARAVALLMSGGASRPVTPVCKLVVLRLRGAVCGQASRLIVTLHLAPGAWLSTQVVLFGNGAAPCAQA
mmetsp:Transcript_67642/g.161386  ORF Transcript_67642/g.161386 Transcript_67642/m.161386 type:complete len:275 (+) Transcript_67642:4004-4828(+)